MRDGESLPEKCHELFEWSTVNYEGLSQFLEWEIDIERVKYASDYDFLIFRKKCEKYPPNLIYKA